MRILATFWHDWLYATFLHGWHHIIPDKKSGLYCNVSIYDVVYLYLMVIGENFLFKHYCLFDDGICTWIERFIWRKYAFVLKFLVGVVVYNYFNWVFVFRVNITVYLYFKCNRKEGNPNKKKCWAIY